MKLNFRSRSLRFLFDSTLKKLFDSNRAECKWKMTIFLFCQVPHIDFTFSPHDTIHCSCYTIQNKFPSSLFLPESNLYFLRWFFGGKSPTIVGSREKCLLNWIEDEEGKPNEKVFCLHWWWRSKNPPTLEFSIYRRDLSCRYNSKISMENNSRLRLSPSSLSLVSRWKHLKVQDRIKVNLIFW